MLHRIRLAMQTGSFDRFDGEVEADETFVGGKAKNMHKHVRERKITGAVGSGQDHRGGHLERGDDGTVAGPRARSSRILDAPIAASTFARTSSPARRVYTDSLKAYRRSTRTTSTRRSTTPSNTSRPRAHQRHRELLGLLKRGLKGTYVSVDPEHLFRYMDERVFTFNMRT